MSKPRIVFLSAIIVVITILLIRLLVSYKELKPITLYLHWHPQAQFIGYFVAKNKGFFQDAGLDVNIAVDLGIGNSMKAAQASSSVFATSLFINLVNSLEQTKDVRTFSVLSKGCNISWMLFSPPEDDFASDLSTKELVSWWGGDDLLVRHLFLSRGLDTNLLSSRLTSTYPKIPTANSAILGMRYNQVMIYERTNIKPRTVMTYCELGIPIFEDVLVGRKPENEHDRLQQRQFAKAAARGWNWALKHPEEALQILRIYNKNLDLAEQRQQLKVFSESIIREGEAVSFYHDRLDSILEMQKTGVISNTPEVNRELSRIRSAESLNFID